MKVGTLIKITMFGKSFSITEGSWQEAIIDFLIDAIMKCLSMGIFAYIAGVCGHIGWNLIK